jgi:chromosome segregation ATPase
MATPSTDPGTASTLEAYESKIAAQIHAANIRIDEFEASAKPKRAQAEVAAIKGLKTARQDLERRLADLKTTRDAHVAQAKADIDAAIVAFQASLDEFRRKFNTPPPATK